MIGTILMVGSGLYLAGAVGYAILVGREEYKRLYVEEKALDEAYKAAKEGRLDAYYDTGNSYVRSKSNRRKKNYRNNNKNKKS